MEQDLRRKAESRATALQQKVDEDVEVVHSLRADLGDAVSRRLSAENVSVKLEKELAHVRRTLQTECDKHDLLQAAVGVVLDALKVVEPVETSPLAARAAGITARVGQLEEINLKVMSEGFPPTYEDDELEAIENVVAPLAKNLADSLKEMVLPSRE